MELGLQTASVLAFPGIARLLQLREEDYNQETTEDRRPQNSSCLVQAWVSPWSKRARPEDKDPNSQATSMSFLALTPHTLPQCHSVQSCLRVGLLLTSSIVCPRTQAQRQRVTSCPVSWDPVTQGGSPSPILQKPGSQHSHAVGPAHICG